MAALFDTSVAVLLLRKEPPEEARLATEAARIEIANGSALLPSIALAELGTGEANPGRAKQLVERLAQLPGVPLTEEAGLYAGSMGGFLRSAGRPIPLPDLLIAGTAVWLDLPLLTWDLDYPRSIELARSSNSAHPGRALLCSIRLHPASIALRI